MARIEKRARMRMMLKDWKRSGDSAAAFCRRHGIKPQALSYWKRVLDAERSGRSGVRRDKPAGLVPVRLVGSAAVGGLEIHLASGERVVFPEGGSMDVLREVVALLRDRC